MRRVFIFSLLFSVGCLDFLKEDVEETEEEDSERKEGTREGDCLDGEDNDEIIASRELGVVIPIMEVSEFIEFEIDYSLIQNGILGVEISAMDCGDGNDRVQENDIICPSGN